MVSFAKNLGITTFSNLFSFFISALVTLIVPKCIGVEEYGYFQLYLFYLSYTGFLHFGWADGIYLRLGGAFYNKLDKKLISGQFRSYFFFECVMSCFVLLIGLFALDGADKQFVFIALSISIILNLPKTFLQYLLQATNRIKEFSRIILFERIVFGGLSLLFVLAGLQYYQLLICFDLLGKAVALGYTIFQCRDIVFHKTCSLRSTYDEAKECIKAGSKLMFSNVASMLILGIIRWSIENQWGVETFGKVSLVISFSNFLLIFVTSVSQVLYPSLRRTDSKNQFRIYSLLRTGIMVPLLGMLLLYYPLFLFLNMWLPAYADSIQYLAVLFPLCVFQAKNSMLVETYLKTLRKENQLLIVNVITLVLSVLLTIATVYCLKNLDLAILSILVLFAFKSVLGELILSWYTKLRVIKDIVLEIMLCSLFVALNVYLNFSVAAISYAFGFLLYLAVKSRDIKLVYKTIRHK